MGELYDRSASSAGTTLRGNLAEVAPLRGATGGRSRWCAPTRTSVSRLTSTTRRETEAGEAWSPKACSRSWRAGGRAGRGAARQARVWGAKLPFAPIDHWDLQAAPTFW